ncbi:DUF4232 domain-containing protein [Wenjunlia tyrosinilytica]|uniref:DUF4232 domain-containing protein n=1 Tax=Wenjunlia tyrosinilytica TaxID=1544741 RepID=A0A917ZUB4_9ACTN|nr:DUF4232 domain-containing protein [Wenjunlia tyrosinilytica]GGO92227.1 hypothetical protein GCM10012280_41920 [Wenjunlia tyrosinilytica]
MNTTTVRRTATALAALSLSALALTACGSDSSDSAAPKPSDKASSSAAPKAKESASGGSSSGDTSSAGSSSGGSTGGAEPASSSGSSGGSKSGGSSGGQTEGDVHPCRTSQLAFKVTQVSRPINHALITATNTSGTACRVPLKAPVVTFGAIDGQAQPMGPGTSSETALETGKSAYAGVRLSRADSSGGQSVTGINIALSAGDKAVTAKLAGQTTINDPQVTVFFASAADALAY